ncbi:MAG: enoyl-CoA hydratase-related protein [Alphaproteobacteria bacterium]
MAQTYKTLNVDENDNVTTIAMDRPKSNNAWTGRMHMELRAAFAIANQDPACAVIVLTGAGERGFCPGGDFQALEGHAERGSYDDGLTPDVVDPVPDAPAPFQATLTWMVALDKPVIAAVNGAAAGVGLALACLADIRFGVRGAKMTTAHGKLNLPAEYGLSWLLPRIVGLGRANDLLLTSRKFTGEEAAQMGLFNQAFDTVDELRAHTAAYAADMAITVSPGSLTATKRQVWLDQTRDLAAAVTESEARLEHMMTEANYKEGLSALLKRRTPDWLRAKTQ